MEEMINDTTVKSMTQLWRTVNESALLLDDEVGKYLSSRLPAATEEERFNEGRYGRATLHLIDANIKALNALRMRVSLQVEGRDNARAKQLDRILGIADDVEDVTIMLDIADRAAARERDEGGGTT